MALDWHATLRRLESYPPGTHRWLPPCSEERLRQLQSELGTLPDAVSDMLRHLNGLHLFMKRPA